MLNCMFIYFCYGGEGIWRGWRGGLGGDWGGTNAFSKGMNNFSLNYKKKGSRGPSISTQTKKNRKKVWEGANPPPPKKKTNKCIEVGRNKHNNNNRTKRKKSKENASSLFLVTLSRGKGGGRSWEFDTANSPGYPPELLFCLSWRKKGSKCS